MFFPTDLPPGSACLDSWLRLVTVTVREACWQPVGSQLAAKVREDLQKDAMSPGRAVPVPSFFCLTDEIW